MDFIWENYRNIYSSFGCYLLKIALSVLLCGSSVFYTAYRNIDEEIIMTGDSLVVKSL